MADGAISLHMTEPRVVDCHFVEGIDIEVRENFVRLVGFIDLERVEGEESERRIVVRAALTTMVARVLVRDLRKALTRGGH